MPTRISVQKNVVTMDRRHINRDTHHILYSVRRPESTNALMFQTITTHLPTCMEIKTEVAMTLQRVIFKNVMNKQNNNLYSQAMTGWESIT